MDVNRKFANVNSSEKATQPSSSLVNNKVQFLSFVNRTINEYLKLNSNDNGINLIEEFVPYYTYSMFLKEHNTTQQSPQQLQKNLNQFNKSQSSQQPLPKSLAQVRHIKQVQTQSKDQVERTQNSYHYQFSQLKRVPKPFINPQVKERLILTALNQFQIQQTQVQPKPKTVIATKPTSSFYQILNGRIQPQPQQLQNSQEEPMQEGQAQNQLKIKPQSTQNPSIDLPDQNKISHPDDSLIKKEPQEQSAESRNRLRERRKNSFKCTLCNYKTNLQCRLAQHRKCHMDKKKFKIMFKCDECKFVGNFQSALDQHKKHHGCRLRFKCEKCSFATSKKSLYNKHKLNDH